MWNSGGGTSGRSRRQVQVRAGNAALTNALYPGRTKGECFFRRGDEAPSVRPCRAKCAQCLPCSGGTRSCRVPWKRSGWFLAQHCAGSGRRQLGAACPSPAWRRLADEGAAAGSSQGSQTAQGAPSAGAAAGESPSAGFALRCAGDAAVSEGARWLWGSPALLKLHRKQSCRNGGSTRQQRHCPFRAGQGIRDGGARARPGAAVVLNPVGSL